MGVRKRKKPEARATKLDVMREPSPDYIVVYSDSATITATFAGMRITFGNIAEINTDKNYMRVSDEVAVGLSPEHAHSLYKALGEQLEAYQKRFGPLRPEPGSKQSPNPQAAKGKPRSA